MSQPPIDPTVSPGRRSAERLRDDALAIWRAGVDAVRGERLIADHLSRVDDGIAIGDDWVDPSRFRRIRVLGAGKAAAAMGEGIERLLDGLGDRIALDGWLNVPEGTERPLRRIVQHPARPAGRNEPTEAGVIGTERLLAMADECGPEDWCWVVLTGGGSALLPAPIAGISLDDKIETTRFLSGAGADILELNAVRRALSRIKGGGLLGHGRPGRVDVLILSDVLGDPLDAIASGPTVPSSTGVREALEILERFDPGANRIPPAVWRVLRERAAAEQSGSPNDARRGHANERSGWSDVRHHVLGNLAVAIDAAGVEAERRGYRHVMLGARRPEGDVRDVARQWLDRIAAMRREGISDCLIDGGEPTVTLAERSIRGLGGRNQQLIGEAWSRCRGSVTTASREATDESLPIGSPDATKNVSLEGLLLLSGGTDGEDGPTDAAGGWLDAQVDRAARDQRLDLTDALRRNDTYSLLERCGGLLVTGPTGTNVGDLRVTLLADPARPYRVAERGESG
ncbi:MAG TPA: glycerate kinase [Planctomycetaceae bacterium]|nr:glycerate kinase [Planctomycetaceae bacterium]HRF00738.1 DUF4147 domain-containing protein [Pirellulaceae bacterium]